MPDNSTILSPGSIILGRYEVLELLGKGGMGSVFHVKHLHLQSEFALKVLNQLADGTAWKRFENEAKAASRLDHPNLIKVHDSGLLPDGQPFFIMEMVNGETLSDMVKKSGHIPLLKTLKIFIQVGFALAYAHENGVIHRDLKPSNIMIVQGPQTGSTKSSFLGRAILLDFGIAKKFDTSNSGEGGSGKTQALTRTGEMIGSPLYMCPEQARGDKLTERSDLYSLGCALFECLTGTAPLIGQSTVDTLILHMEKPAPSLKEASLGRDYPAGLERVVRKLLSKDPEARYQSAEETKRALALALQLDEQAVEVTPEKSEKVVSHTLLILLSVAAVLTLSTIAFLTMQGEKESRHANSADDEDKIKLEEMVVSEVDKTILDKPSANANPDSDDDESETNKEPESAVYTEIKGTEPGFALRGQTIEAARVKLIENDKNLWGLGLAGAKFPHSMLGNLSPKVGVLRLSSTNLSDEDMKYVAKNKVLRQLYLNSNPVGIKGIRYLTSLRFLKVLDLGNTKCDARAIAELRRLPNLEELHLHNNKKIDDSAAEVASSLVGLKLLDLNTTSVTGKGVSYLHHIPMLSTLFLERLKLKDQDISTLPHIANLTHLHLSNNQITSAGIKSLLPLKHLVSLDLENNPIDDKAAPLFAKMDALGHLGLNGTLLTADGVMKLAEMRSLNDLHVRRLLGLNEPQVYNFMSKSKTCQELDFMTGANSSVKREDWLLDQRRKGEMPGAPATESNK